MNDLSPLKVIPKTNWDEILLVFDLIEADEKTNRKYLEIVVKPNSKFQNIKILPNGVLEFRLTSPPVEGKANAELIKFLRKILKLRDPKIEAGLRSRSKIISFAAE